MTLTRTYYTQLISLLKSLCSLNENDPLTFDQLKKDLFNNLNRVSKFNLFPLTFSKDFWSLIDAKTLSNFTSQKLKLINELHFELHECLYTTRLRYGGELLFYLFELKLAILKLPVEELKLFENILKKPEHFYFQSKKKISTDNEKKELIEELKSKQKKSIIRKEKITIKEKDYELIESDLKKDISTYQDYIALNYPTIAPLFSFYGKKIRAYITEAMPKDIFEFRIHAYESNSKISSVKLIHEYYDFYPAYFYNLEEITEKQTAAMVISLNKSDLKYNNPFSQLSIFRELTTIYIANAKPFEIIEFTEFLLKCHFYKIKESPIDSQIIFDLYAEKEKSFFAFEIYHHKSQSLDKITNRINYIKKCNSEYSISFIFSSHPGSLITNKLIQNDIKPIQISELVEKIISVKNTKIVEWYLMQKLNELNFTQTSTKKDDGKLLIQRLDGCPPGEKHWSEYESLGIDIFRFLFEDSFRSYMAEEQVENDLRNHRRDLIVSNYFKDPTSFWAEIKHTYNSKAIIVEFKNYTNKLNSTTFFSISKYATKKVGHFALVFSRKGLDKSAIHEQRQLYADGKLLIEFSDLEIKEMIHEKIIGNDPLDRLKSKEFEIITS